MKFLSILLVISAFSQFAIAQDLRLGDINYFQNKNSVLIDTAIRYESGKANKDTDTKASVFSNKLNYGVSETYNVGLAIDYAFNSESKPDGGKATKNPGMSDVVINNNFRVYNKDFFFDIIADLTIATGDQEVGNSSKDGSYNNGANGVSLAAVVGDKNENSQWRSGIRLDYFDEKYYTELANEDLEKYAVSTLDLTIFYNHQKRLNEKLSLLGGLDLKYVGNKDYEKEIDNGGTQDSIFRESPHFVAKLNLGALYNVAESFTLKLNLAYTPTYSYDTFTAQTTGTQSNSDAKVEGVSQTAISLGALILF